MDFFLSAWSHIAVFLTSGEQRSQRPTTNLRSNQPTHVDAPVEWERRKCDLEISVIKCWTSSMPPRIENGASYHRMLNPSFTGLTDTTTSFLTFWLTSTKRRKRVSGRRNCVPYMLTEGRPAFFNNTVLMLSLRFFRLFSLDFIQILNFKPEFVKWISYI